MGWRVLAHIPARPRRRAGNAAGVSAPPEPRWPRIPDPNTSAPGRLENRGRSASASHRLPVRAGFLHKTQPSRAAARRQRPLGPGRDSGSSLPPRALRPLPHSPGGKPTGRDRAGSSWCCTPSPNTPNSTPGASQGIFGTLTMKKKGCEAAGRVCAPPTPSQGTPAVPPSLLAALTGGTNLVPWFVWAPAAWAASGVLFRVRGLNRQIFGFYEPESVGLWQEKVGMLMNCSSHRNKSGKTFSMGL